MGVDAKAASRAQSWVDITPKRKKGAWRSGSKDPTNSVRVHCTSLLTSSTRPPPRQPPVILNQLNFITNDKVTADSLVDMLVVLCPRTGQPSSHHPMLPRSVLALAADSSPLLFAHSSRLLSTAPPISSCVCLGVPQSVSSLAGCHEFQALHVDLWVHHSILFHFILFLRFHLKGKEGEKGESARD